MMVTVVDQQRDAQRKHITLANARAQKPGEISRVLARFHPDPCLDASAADREHPDWQRISEMDALRAQVSWRNDLVPRRSIGVQRIFVPPVAGAMRRLRHHEGTAQW